MFDIVSDISSAFSHLKPFTPSEYRLGYTRNVSYHDTFRIGYESGLSNWDVNASAIWNFWNNKFFHEIEFNSMKSTPSLSINDATGWKIISAMGHITGIENISSKMVEDIHTIRGISGIYGLYRKYPINQNTNLYFGSCLGLVKILQYQGFKKNAEDLYGITKGIKFGVSYSVNANLAAYTGYIYRKNAWKYKTDTIYDQNGNSVAYELLDFEFISHGIEVGLRFLVN